MKRLLLFVVAGFCWAAYCFFAIADDAANTFEGDKYQWHGFDRYDFVIDDATKNITPFKVSDREGNGISGAPQGQRRCVVVIPKKFADGNPWSWRGCYWDHEPQTEIELLKRGFAIAHITGSPDAAWEAWHTFLVEKHSFSSKPAFIGMSRGGEFSYTWSVRHPDKVSCIYADNPGTNPEVFPNLGKLAANDVPLLHINGSLDPLLGKISGVIENLYHQYGGRITVVVKDGAGHHPHSLRNPKFAADFIEKSVFEKKPPKPDFVPERFTKTSFYPSESLYKEFPDERNYMTCRGPGFAPVYNRYEFSLRDVEGSIQVVVPNEAATGTPWVFRPSYLERDEAVDNVLLSKGFHIVTGPIPYNADGARLPHWNTVYKYLTERGFSAKPVLQGSGGGASEAFGWAIANPDKVSCVYVENPLLRRSFLLEKSVLENLEAVKIPVIAYCGEQDTWFNEYHEKLTPLKNLKILKEPNRGHLPLSPVNEKILDGVCNDILDAVGN
ncbi:MAG: hypothetical protein LBU65_03705 [Planctomycetaceae bacterium]|nr:hypothetical protein [Planctomycetaceae bacterium]